MKTRKWIIWLIVLGIIGAIAGGVYVYALSRLPVSYGEKTALSPEEADNEDYLSAWR